MVPPGPDTLSAIRSAVKVLPVPQAMMSFPRRCASKPVRTPSMTCSWWGSSARLGPERERLGVLATEVWPLERLAREICEAQHGARRGQPADGLRRVAAPLVAGVDQDPRGECCPGRERDEGVEVLLSIRVPGA